MNRPILVAMMLLGATLATEAQPPGAGSLSTHGRASTGPILGRRGGGRTFRTFVRVTALAPQGSEVFFLDPSGTQTPVDARSPVVLRLGGVYAFLVKNLPDTDPTSFFGTIEVRDVLRPPVGADDRRVSAPLRITDEDSLALAEGGMVTKVLVVEDPEMAVPVQGSPDELIRYDLLSGENLFASAEAYGRVLLVVRIGNRRPLETMRASESTVSKAIRHDRFIRPVGYCKACDESSQACPPTRPAPSSYSGRYIDPSLLDWRPGSEEFLCDGGDDGLRYFRDSEGRMRNLDAGDTLVEYQVGEGPGCVRVANEVCVYAPRFAEVVFVRRSSWFEGLRGPELARRRLGLDTVSRRERLDRREVIRRPQGVRMRERTSGLSGEAWQSAHIEVRALEGYEQAVVHRIDRSEISPVPLSATLRPAIQARIQLARELSVVQFPQVLGLIRGAGQVEAVWLAHELREVEEPPGCPCIEIHKSVDAEVARVGDVLTFTIEYRNTGTQAVSNVAVVDNLTGRLEYVSDSAESSRDAVFVAEPNDLGSQTLRWEFSEPLGAGESGQVRFQARVR